jgi:two-component system, OmpR family, response regulator QseB
MSTTSRPRVLLVEDDGQLGPLIVELLGEDFDVTLVRDGQQGLHLGLTRGWDALVIDRGLPLLDGIDLIAALRRKGVAAPILVLTALGSVPDKVDGLDAGANDYLVKPFDAAELAARLRALTRSYGVPDRTLDVGQWTFDTGARTLTSPYGESLVLSPREAGLLALLAREPDRIFTRDEILAAVFDKADQAGSVDTYVYYLRRKLGHDVVQTIRGAGYRLGEPS